MLTKFDFARADVVSSVQELPDGSLRISLKGRSKTVTVQASGVGFVNLIWELSNKPNLIVVDLGPDGTDTSSVIFGLPHGKDLSDIIQSA